MWLGSVKTQRANSWYTLGSTNLARHKCVAREICAEDIPKHLLVSEVGYLFLFSLVGFIQLPVLYTETQFPQVSLIFVDADTFPDYFVYKRLAHKYTYSSMRARGPASSTFVRW